MNKPDLKNKTVAKIITTVLVVIAVLLLTVVMVTRTSSRTRQDSLSRMSSVTQEQAMMINDYIDNAEKTLSSFAESDIIYEYLTHQDNPDLAAAAQDYTCRVGKTIDYLEGLWVGSWETEILCHTVESNVGKGIVTRPRAKMPERLKALQDGMLTAGENGDGNGVCNLGIIKSPVGEHALIVSLYKAVYDRSTPGEHNPVGFVGLGVYTKALGSSLGSMKLNTDGSSYAMISLHDDSGEVSKIDDGNGNMIPNPDFIVNKSYLFNSDESAVNTAVSDPTILSIIENKIADFDPDKDNYVQDKGNIIFYNYMQDREWLFVVQSPAKEVFSFSKSINTNMILFCIVCIILIVIFNIISIKQEETLQELEKSERKQAAITKNLHTAALKDLLTDVNNRIKFIDDFSKDEEGNYKIEDCPNNPYCFIMFSLPRFSKINIMYGHDTGDMVLITTGEILKDYFGADKVYRTGSDEFVVAVQSTSSNAASVVMEANGVLSDLRRSRKIGSNMMSVAYTAAVVKKSTAITSSVLITLKDMINNSISATETNVAFVDMDNL